MSAYRNPSRTTLVILGFCLLSFVTAACGGGSNTGGGDQGSGGEKATRQLDFILDFSFFGRHAYYFVAQEKGYYADEGLDVSFQRSQGSSDAIAKVGAGQADMGFADAGTLVLSRANDNVPVKLAAVVYQKAPHAVYVLESSGIEEPKDLEGKTLADSAGSSNYRLFPAFAKAAGIDESTIEWQLVDSSGLPRLLAAKRVDGIGQYVLGEPLLDQAVEPESVRPFQYSDYGLKFYANGIVASEEMLENNPEVVKAFVRATVRGMEDAFNDPERAGEISHEYHREIEAEVATAETKLVAELAQNTNTEEHGLGHIDPEMVENTIEVVSGSFDLQREVAPEEMFVSGYTPGK